MDWTEAGSGDGNVAFFSVSECAVDKGASVGIALLFVQTIFG
jgi:hypothetical protein